MEQSKHAENMVRRFRNLVEDAGDSLPDNHYNELRLIIEAGLDTALLETMECVAGKLDGLADDVRHKAEYFDSA